MNELKYIVAKKLLQLKSFSVQLTSPFIWGNGWKAPMYLDDRKILSYTYPRNFIKLELSRLVAEKYPDADVIAGIATTAIAHGVLVAEQLGLPFIYVHPEPKNHGLENQIEGDLRPRQKVVVIENQVNEGKNALRVIEAIRNNGCTVLGVVSIFDYQFPQSKTALEQAGVEITSITDFSTVMKVVQEDNLSDENTLKGLEEWHANPTKWHKKK